MTVEQIVKQYLIDNGFDGLREMDGECACDTQDLFPCNSELTCRCEAGYKVPCDSECGEGHNFHITLIKEKP